MSLVSAVFIFLIAWRLLCLGYNGTPMGTVALSWLALFWMTSPCAWVYALPAEIWFEPVAAAKANFALLLLVSAWRVWLMAKVLHVLGRRRFRDCLETVLLPCALEMGVASAGKFLGLLEASVGAGMGGLRLPPDHGFLSMVTLFLMSGSLVLFLGCLCRMPGIRRRSLEDDHDRAPRISPLGSTRFPAGILALAGLLLAAGLWLAQPTQARIANNRELDALFDAEHFAEALTLVRTKSYSDFSAIHPIPPDPYGPHGWDFAEKVLPRLEGNEDPEILQLYLERAGERVNSRRYQYQYLDDLAPAIISLLGFPEGREYVRKNAEVYQRLLDPDSFETLPENWEAIVAELNGVGIEPPERKVDSIGNSPLGNL